MIAFNDWLGQLPHQHKLVIAGNHELSFDPAVSNRFSKNSRCKHNSGLLDEMPTLGHDPNALKSAATEENIRQYLTNCTYLEDESVELYGLKFYGTPWQPE